MYDNIITNVIVNDAKIKRLCKKIPGYKRYEKYEYGVGGDMIDIKYADNFDVINDNIDGDNRTNDSVVDDNINGNIDDHKRLVGVVNDDTNDDIHNINDNINNNQHLVGGSKSKQTKTSLNSNKRKQTKSSHPLTKVKLTPMFRFITNTFIFIRYTRDDPSSFITAPLFNNAAIRSRHIALTIHQYVITFLRHLNFVIAAKTNANYHLIDNKQLYIKIPIYVYTNDEATMNPADLIEKRFETLRTFIESYDFSKDTKNTLWLIRTLTSLGVNLNSDFTMSVECNEFDYNKLEERLQFRYPDVEYPSIKRHCLKDESIIVEYEDPYFNDYGVFINLSVPFNEMGMSYNGLHIYEHLMTKGWANLSVNDQLYANGITYQNGICMVFSILNTSSAFDEYTRAAIEWMYKIRDVGFWENEINDDILLETQRTISETRTERTMASMGRSDIHAYTNSYNRKIFEYWSNKPYVILLTKPKGCRGVNVNEIEKMSTQHPLRPIDRPNNIKFKYYPYEVMVAKKYMKLYILRTEIDRIKDAILKPKLKTKVYFGVDCYMGQDMTEDGNDLSEFNGVLHPLLYLCRYFTEDELNTFVRTHVTACSSTLMSNQSMMIRHAADVLEECNLNV